MKNVKDFFYSHKSQLIGLTVGSLTVAVPTLAHADTNGTSLLTSDVTTIITGFAANIVPTVLAMIAILIPVSLTLWAIGFGVKKGISFLQKKASKAI